MQRAFRERVQVAQTYGFEFVKRTGGNHLLFRHHNTGSRITCPSTASDHRSLKKFESDCVRWSKIRNGV